MTAPQSGQGADGAGSGDVTEAHGRPAPRVVAVGGGHGLAEALRALRLAGVAPTAVVTVADDGGSSGRLRRDLDIIAPGDLRMALLALARNTLLADALGHRFQRGHLQGHPLGNLLLVGLAEQAGGAFLPALRRAGELLDCEGAVLPSTTEAVQLHAQVSGRRIDGQAQVTSSAGCVERMWLEPGDPPACQEAVDAILAADAVVLGPGSLFTSVIVNLLVPDLTRALRRTPARLFYIANVLTQPGETAGLDLPAHVDAVLAHLDGRDLDAVVVHDGPPGQGPGEPVGATLRSERVRQVVLADVVRRHPDGRPGGGHDPERLRAALVPLLDVHVT